MEFKERLMEMRKQNGWSQEQLGEKLEVTRQTISKWENGDTTPEMNKLIELGKIFEISIDELVGSSALLQKQRTVAYLSDSYEFKSKLKIFGLPLVHINCGRHGLHHAKGIIAIGNVATGIVSLGAVSVGVVSLGALSLGLLLSMGAISVGALSLGGLAAGIFAAGGLAFGIYAMGGAAIAVNIAVGGFASGIVAIGDETRGSALLDIKSHMPSAMIYEIIMQKLPQTPKWIIELFSLIN